MTDYNKISKQEQIKFVKRDGYNIQYIKNPSIEVQIAAIKQYSLSIRFIDDPCQEAQLMAIKRNVYNIRKIAKPSEAAQMLVVNSLISINLYSDSYLFSAITDKKCIDKYNKHKNIFEVL